MDDASAAPNAPDVTEITVCDCCKSPLGEPSDRGGLALLRLVEDALAARPETERRRLRLRRFSCLMNCSRPCSAAIGAARGPAKLAYALGALPPTPDSAEALIDYALRHAESDSGVVAYAAWPEMVKGRFIARIPPSPEASRDETEDRS